MLLPALEHKINIQKAVSEWNNLNPNIVIYWANLCSKYKTIWFIKKISYTDEEILVKIYNL